MELPIERNQKPGRQFRIRDLDHRESSMINNYHLNERYTDKQENIRQDNPNNKDAVVSSRTQKKGTRKVADASNRQKENSVRYVRNENSHNSIYSHEFNKEKLIFKDPRTKVEVKTDEPSGESVRQIARSVFKTYAIYSKEDDCYVVKQLVLKKILSDSGIMDKLKINDIDILIRKINSHKTKLDEKQFMNFLVLVAQKMFPKVYKTSKKQAIDKVIVTYLGSIKKQPNNEESNLLTEENIQKLIETYQPDNVTKAMVNDVKLALRDIYRVYFTIELDTAKKTQSKVKLFKDSFAMFCKDFEIEPFLLSFSQVIIYYDTVMKVTDNGRK